MTEIPDETDNDPAIPVPTAPLARREPLPCQQPKPSREDPEAPERVGRIIASPSYRVASADPDFLQSDDTRGLRLLLDYLKPELALQRHGVERAIVVFGGTRICEPAEARRRADEACARLAAAGGPQAAPDLAARLDVAERIVAASRYYDVARELGRLIGAANDGDGRPTTLVMTGGGPGIMEAANRGAFDAGAETIGLNIALPHEQYPNPYVTPALCFQFHYFALRKLHFMQRARALVAFPGGYGTLDELFEVLNLVQTRVMKPIPIVLVGVDFWRQAVDFDFLVAEGVIDVEDRGLFWFAETAPEIYESLIAWERKAQIA
ncbi:TIGR00730 family Rossman fold protein [Rhodoblastus sp.]|uniref:LOG family protein n=1 Tax=Rhodoblastus sp. TaxID=1962975 RepID=UPI0025DD440F|nr:TIGR00730 family Rossman fold protein [Rhodoblastus sp.]